jgi:hypothetical protein
VSVQNSLAASVLQASGFRGDVTVFRLNAAAVGESGSERAFRQNTALTRTRLEVDTDGAGWVLNDSWFGKVWIRGESAGGKTLFMGIGPD